MGSIPVGATNNQQGGAAHNDSPFLFSAYPTHHLTTEAGDV